MLLLSSNSALIRHFNVVGDMVGGGDMDLDLFLEIGDAVVVGDSELEVIVGWDCVGGVK